MGCHLPGVTTFSYTSPYTAVIRTPDTMAPLFGRERYGRRTRNTAIMPYPYAPSRLSLTQAILGIYLNPAYHSFSKGWNQISLLHQFCLCWNHKLKAVITLIGLLDDHHDTISLVYSYGPLGKGFILPWLISDDIRLPGPLEGSEDFEYRLYPCNRHPILYPSWHRMADQSGCISAAAVRSRTQVRT
jgi:hypothetical protein